mgnify:CR=1 FL=1
MPPHPALPVAVVLAAIINARVLHADVQEPHPTDAVKAAKQAAEGRGEVRDAVGNLLSDGDQVTLIKDLEVKGAGKGSTSFRNHSALLAACIKVELAVKGAHP